MKKIITIDGLASSGKSTLSRLLAKKLNWTWLSSGVLYRGFAYVGAQENFKTEEEYLNFIDSKKWKVDLTSERSCFFYNDQNVTEEIYGEKIDDLSSTLSAKVELRKRLIPIQRAFYKPDSKKGLIIEGRDSGTIIFPDAPLKIFLDAPEITRARRRARDRVKDENLIFLAQKERDRRDQNRSFAPVRRAKDSVVLSSKDYNSEEMVNRVYKEFQKTFHP